jgi:VanZ family protein
VVERDFQGLEKEGLEPLEYRNLFISSDRAAYTLEDCLLNILGFVPFPLFIFLVLSPRVRRRAWVAVFAVPVLLGGATSGFIEWTQRQLDGRVPCALDLAYNLLGTLVGSLLLWTVVSFRRRRLERRRRTP